MTSKARVLVVEDHADALTVLKTLLQRRGYKVTTAIDVRSGIDAGMNHEFDILLCDINLPDGRGTEILRQLRSVKSFPAIALTAYGSEADITHHLSCGFNSHISKPYEFLALEKTMHTLLTNAAVLS